MVQEMRDYNTMMAAGEFSSGSRRPSEIMTQLGIIQAGEPILDRPTQTFDLPAEADEARRIVESLLQVMNSVSAVHNFAKGVGLAAPQIGIGRSAAVVRFHDADEPLILLNPVVVSQSDEMSEQYEGCLSFFDVRGIAICPKEIEVQYSTYDGQTITSTFRDGEARLVNHEINHLFGILYTSQMPAGSEPIPVEEYRQTGRPWNY